MVAFKSVNVVRLNEKSARKWAATIKQEKATQKKLEKNAKAVKSK